MGLPTLRGLEEACAPSAFHSEAQLEADLRFAGKCLDCADIAAKESSSNGNLRTELKEQGGAIASELTHMGGVVLQVWNIDSSERADPYVVGVMLQIWDMTNLREYYLILN